jgi:hypothetical protein
VVKGSRAQSQANTCYTIPSIDLTSLFIYIESQEKSKMKKSLDIVLTNNKKRKKGVCLPRKLIEASKLYT